MAKTFIFGCVLFGAFACATMGYQTKLVAQQVTIRHNVNLTLLHAAVVDRSGQFVAGLGKSDFQLSVDGVWRPITVFEPDDAPVAAGILVDNSASMMNKGSYVISAALAFARASNPQDKLFVVHFSDQARLGLPPNEPFTGDISQLEAALSSFAPEGTTALYDAIALAISHIQETELERKVLLIVSDGGDNSSHESFVDVLNRTQKAGVIAYCIGIYDDTDRDRRPHLLTKFAQVTGGKAFFPTELRDVTETCVKIAKDIRLQYTLGFEGQEDGEYHRIKITAQKQKYGELTVRTRSGYLAPKP
jgi:VWFA-related protein